jgi:hypothetical protein
MKGKRAKPRGVRRSELAADLSKDLPALGPEEWDFRWIRGEKQLRIITDYEVGREVLRLAWHKLLKSLNPAEAKLAWASLVEAGRLKRLLEYASIPGSSNYVLAKRLEVVMSAGHRFTEDAPIPPPVFANKGFVSKRLRMSKARPKLLFQAQVEQEWTPDSEGDCPPDDEFAMRGWGEFHVPTPCHQVILHIPMFKQLTRKQAQAQFRKWVAESDLFIGPGKKVTPMLMRLAFFRFNQGRIGLGVPGRFAQQFEPRNAKTGAVNRATAPFGLNLFGPVINARYGGVQVLWSKSLKMVSESVHPLASRLAHEAELALREAQSPRAQLPTPTGRWRRS